MINLFIMINICIKKNREVNELIKFTLQVTGRKKNYDESKGNKKD